MDPVTLGVISIAGTVLSAGVGAVGAIQQAGATADAARYQQQVAKNNQTIADQNAAYARQAGQVAAQQESMKTAAIVGQEVAAQGASGIDPTTGSPSDVVRGTRTVGRLNTLNTIQNAELRARGYDIEASNFGATAQLKGMEASNAKTAGLYAAGSSLIGGASSFATKWSKFQSEGTFGSSSLGDWSPRGG